MHHRAVVLSLLLASTACGGGDKPDAPAAEAAPAEVATPVQPAGLDGKAEFLICQSCHGENGAGMPGAFPPLAGSEWLTGDAKIPIAIVLHGLEGPIEVAGQPWNGAMAAWGQLSDEQIAAILTYARSSWGNTASPVTPQEVAAVRAATAGRTGPWKGDEVKSAAL